MKREPTNVHIILYAYINVQMDWICRTFETADKILLVNSVGAWQRQRVKLNAEDVSLSPKW